MLQARDTYSVLYGRVKSADEEEPSEETLSVLLPDNQIPPIRSTSPLGSPQQRCRVLFCSRLTALVEKVPSASNLSQRRRLVYQILGNTFNLTLSNEINLP